LENDMICARTTWWMLKNGWWGMKVKISGHPHEVSHHIQINPGVPYSTVSVLA
jgi:hypothetical protein